MLFSVLFLGRVRQYRLFRAKVSFGTDSMLYPYDTQTPSLKFQSLDYGDDVIRITTKTLNNLNEKNPEWSHEFKNLNSTNIQARFHIIYKKL